MKGLFRYPEKAKFGRIIPKAKIYEHAKLKPAQKAQFIDLIQQIRWAYKLAPETINLSATDDVREIQILRIRINSVIDRRNPAHYRQRYSFNSDF